MQTDALAGSSPYMKLFNQSPNYMKLRVFGCSFYPWLHPYTTHKLDDRSTRCVFMGYSLTQSAYLCYDTKTGRMYTSRHVKFNEAEFPYSAASRATEIQSSEMDVNPSHVPLHTILPSQLIPQLPRALRLRHHRLLRQHRQQRQHLCHCHSPNNQYLKISLPQLQLLPLPNILIPHLHPLKHHLILPHKTPHNRMIPYLFNLLKHNIST